MAGRGSAQQADPAAGTPHVVVQRTGGFAGLKHTVELDPRGTWTAATRAGTQSGGELTADQLSVIRDLAADPRIAAEAAQTRGPSKCRDAFHYAVTVGDAHVDFAKCPADADQPVASLALADRLLAFTIGRG